MAFTPKDWRDELNPLGPPADPDTATPFDAAAVEDLETRLSDYTDTAVTEASPALNVKSAFNAAGDGTTDDTTEIQAAITAAGVGGGIVYFPPGHYKFSTLTIPAGVSLAGAGAQTFVNDPFGTGTWMTDSNLKGTVLRSTATSGKAITINQTAGVQSIRDFLLVGPGSGTSAGIGTDNLGIGGFSVANVMVVNFSIGWDLNFVEDSVFTGARSRACKTGFKLTNATNQNEFVQTEVQFSDTDGITLDNSSQNRFSGILLQNISGTSGIRQITGESNVYDGIWPEAVSATWAIDIVAGSNVAVSNVYASGITGSGGLLRTASRGSILKHINSPDSPAISILAGASFSTVMHITDSLITDAADNTLRLSPDGFSDFVSMKWKGPLASAYYSDPGAPPASHAYLYTRLSGGKGQLCIKFPTGAVQVIATEP